MTLMAMANFKSKEWEWKGEKYSVEAGQFITSLESIKVNTGIVSAHRMLEQL